MLIKLLLLLLATTINVDIFAFKPILLSIANAVNLPFYYKSQCKRFSVSYVFKLNKRSKIFVKGHIVGADFYGERFNVTVSCISG